MQAFYQQGSLLSITAYESPLREQPPPGWPGHSTHALLCLLEGRCQVLTGSQPHSMHRAGFFLAPPHTPYLLAFGEGSNTTLLVVQFSDEAKSKWAHAAADTGLDLFACIPARKAIHLPADQAQVCHALLHRMHYEISAKREHSGAFLLSAVQLLLVELARSGGQPGAYTEPPESEQKSASALIKQMLQYINSHYMEPISLSEVAKKLYANPSYLSRAFKNTVGVGFTDYVNNKRIFEAKNLLVSTDKKISEIAMQVGFSNISYFNSLFLKVVGSSPRDFRARF